MKKFYNEIKNLNKIFIRKKIIAKYKEDNTLVTNLDILIEKKIKSLIASFFPDIKQIISEESFSLKNFKKINFNESFAIFDPIDGTENFASGLLMYGQMISIRSLKHGNIDIINIPSLNLFLHNKMIFNFKKISKFNLISLSSKSLRNNKKIFKNTDNYRVFGSSAYSFAMILEGKIEKIIYSQGAKIWDYYTGLALCNLAGLKIICDNKNWEEKPNFQMNYKVIAD
jgi:fructose-1,6-bisphosphatase/inositol monophosphatase family enzyme